jgi:hypothetical protein
MKALMLCTDRLAPGAGGEGDEATAFAAGGMAG